MKTPSRLRLTAVLAALAAGLAIPAAASADATISANWSGYAAHRSGTAFRTATASWRQPAASCTSGSPTYSAFWVGIGGYSLSSNALEQIGSELDCATNGTATMSAWYELVPSASKTVRMTIGAGDLIHASVTVVGHAVTVAISDATRGESFRKTIVTKTVDTSSAEWITEAPSECSSSTSCTTLPLANFGKVSFSGASATTASGRTGSISSSLWKTTRIILGTNTAGGIRFVSAGGSSFAAAPTNLSAAGRAFKVAYLGGTTSTSTGSTGSGGFGGNPGSPGGPGGGGGGGGQFGAVRR